VLLLAGLAVLLTLALLWLRAGAERPLPAAPDLETAAIARGLVPDPQDRDIVGLYARDTDRICIVQKGGYRIGVSVDYADRIACSAAGTVERSRDSLQVTLSPDCRLEARFDGDRIVFPPRVPQGCRTLCRGRASLAAVDVERLSASGSEAAAMRTATGKLPCSG
jgi:hypothetical protein